MLDTKMKLYGHSRNVLNFRDLLRILGLFAGPLTISGLDGPLFPSLSSHWAAMENQLLGFPSFYRASVRQFPITNGFEKWAWLKLIFLYLFVKLRRSPDPLGFFGNGTEFRSRRTTGKLWRLRLRSSGEKSIIRRSAGKSCISFTATAVV